MGAYAINPPNTPLVNQRGYMTTEWYRYFVQNKASGDGLVNAPVVTFGPSTVFPNSRSLEVAAGEITETDGGTTVTLGLANTTVASGTYGAGTRLVVLTIDAKGRITSASEVILNSDNVTEGGTNLFFTNARARASISGASGISYNSGTGVLTLDQSFTRGLLSGSGQITYNNTTGVIGSSGKSGTGAYTNFTFVNGICTAAS